MQGVPCCPYTIAQHNAVKESCLHVDSMFSDISTHESRLNSNSGVVSIRRFSRNNSNKPHLLKAKSLASDEQNLEDMAMQDASQSDTKNK